MSSDVSATPETLRHQYPCEFGCVYCWGATTQFVGLFCVGETSFGKLGPRCDSEEMPIRGSKRVVRIGRVMFLQGLLRRG